MFFRSTAERISTLITDGFAAVIGALLAWHSARFVLFEREDNTQFLDLMPIWPLQIILPVGFGIIALRLLLNALLNRRGQSVS